MVTSPLYIILSSSCSFQAPVSGGFLIIHNGIFTVFRLYPSPAATLFRPMRSQYFRAINDGAIIPEKLNSTMVSTAQTTRRMSFCRSGASECGRGKDFISYSVDTVT